MKKTTRPGQPVTFSIGQGKRLLRLTGTIERISGDYVHVRANGSLYEVHRRRALDVLTCIVCGGPRAYRSRRYCSNCWHVDRMQDSEEDTFQTIVEFKAEHDGCSPSFWQIVQRSGMGERTVKQAIRRLHKSGRIKITGRQRSWQIEVPGGRWVYEGDNSGDTNQNLAAPGTGRSPTK